jgi:ApaG protein
VRPVFPSAAPQKTPLSDRKYQLSITVQHRYLAEQSDPGNGQFAFAYTVRITNAGSVATQVISRHWVITDGNDKVVEVKGLGIVGHQPLLAPGQSFEYTSGSQLATPAGTMQGSYFCVADDGERFEAPIPAFSLSMPRTLH